MKKIITEKDKKQIRNTLHLIIRKTIRVTGIIMIPTALTMILLIIGNRITGVSMLTNVAPFFAASFTASLIGFVFYAYWFTRPEFQEKINRRRYR